MKGIALVVALALASSACVKVTYRNPQMQPVGGSVSKTGHFFIGGLVGTATIPAYQLCPSGVAEVKSKSTFGDLVLTFITIFIYSPRTYEIQCGAASGG